MTLTVLEATLTTYAWLPSGVIAITAGLPTDPHCFAPRMLVEVLMTLTLLEPELAT